MAPSMASLGHNELIQPRTNMPKIFFHLHPSSNLEIPHNIGLLEKHAMSYCGPDAWFGK